MDHLAWNCLVGLDFSLSALIGAMVDNEEEWNTVCRRKRHNESENKIQTHSQFVVEGAFGDAGVAWPICHRKAGPAVYRSGDVSSFGRDFAQACQRNIPGVLVCGSRTYKTEP